MKKLLLLLALTATACSMKNEADSRVAPTITLSDAPLEEPTVARTEIVMVQAQLLNRSGVLYVNVDYTLTWNDEDGREHSQKLASGVRSYRPTDSGRFYYEELIPPFELDERTDARVTWQISAENEYGLGAVSEKRSYKIQNQS